MNFIWTINAGNLGWRGDGAVNSAIVSLQWSERFSTVHQFDILNTSSGTNFAVDGQADNSIGQVNYAFFDVTERLKAGVRQEWYKADGTSYNTLTYGVNIFPMENLVIRPEVRHMWAPGNNNLYGPNADINLYNQTVFTVDAVLSY